MKKYASLEAIKKAISAGETTLPALVAYYLDRIGQFDSLNAFIEVFSAEAQQQAELIGQKMANGTAGKLAGMVIGIKDNICYKDHKVSAASKILDGYVSIFSSTVVERLLQEDAIIIGRLNCDEFAMGGSNETSYFGPARNHVDNTKVPGGSSGGSAVAVQADLCLAALGTDTGGSVRQPASFCGVIGLKPTYGRVSRHGIIAYASSFDQVGPITSSVEDAALLLNIMAGADEYDSTASTQAVPDYSSMLQAGGKKKIAFLKEALESEGVDAEIKERCQAQIAQLKALGHEVDLIGFDYLEHVVPTYYVLTAAEASSNLSRYDGVHYGYRSADVNSLEEVYKKSRSEGFGKEVKRRIMLGTFVLSAGYYDAYYAKAQKVRRLIREKTEELLSQYDFIMLPTAPTAPFAIGECIDDPLVMYLADIFTVQANLAGIPAISLPMGNNGAGLPLGIQFMAGYFKEAELLAFSKYMLENVKN